jgi:hypothetical protein
LPRSPSGWTPTRARPTAHAVHQWLAVDQDARRPDHIGARESGHRQQAGVDLCQWCLLRLASDDTDRIGDPDRGDNAPITGNADSSRVRRKESYEVVGFINAYTAKMSLVKPGSGLRLEDRLHACDHVMRTDMTKWISANIENVEGCMILLPSGCL